MPWIILLFPFLILAFSYNSIPNEILIWRGFIGSDSIVAPKTLFTVFRVPLIEVVCALAIETMRHRFADSNSPTHADYYTMWSILLYTVAFKSLSQTFEDVSSEKFVNLFFYMTAAIVVIGIILIIRKGRKFFSAYSREDWKLNRMEKSVLIILFVAYLGLAFLPAIIFN